jgi:TonB family protein
LLASALVCAAAALTPGPLSAAPPEPSAERAPDAAATEPESEEPSEQAAPAAPIAPPKVRSAPIVYPPGETRAATVMLELVIERDGSVALVQVLSGDEPFASAARDAALRWRFEPALRGAEPVRARIRFEVAYAPPEPVPAPALPEEARPAPGPAVQVTEVRVVGEVTPGTLRMTAGEARITPGAFGDPFRAVSDLPGVGHLVTGLPLFFVRGAPPGNLGFLIDGVRVPLLFHAFLGPAVIHPRLIERIDLHAGGYPASFGKFAGGVVSADLVEPAGKFNGEWSVRLVDAGAFVDAPFAGGRGNAMIAGRYSYTALLLSLLSDLTLEYWDYQALVSYDLSARGQLSLLSCGAYDYAATPPDESEGETASDSQNAVSFHRVDLRYDHRYSESTKLRVAGTLGVDVTRGGQGRVRDLMGAGRLELRSQLAPAVLLRTGASFDVDDYDLELALNTENFTDVAELFPSRTDSVLSAHADVVLDAARDVTLTPGVRVDRYASGGRTEIGVSPRLAASFRVHPSVSIEHALGIADQPPNFVPGVPGVAVAGLPGGLQRSVQASAGVRAELPASFSGTATLFQNAYFGLTDPFSQNQDLELDADEARIRSTGHAVGLEVLLRRRLTRGFGATISYTLSRSLRSHDRIQTLSGYDRPHVLNAGASYDLGSHWLASARAVFYSGVPGARRRGDERVYDQDRARPFFRVDLRLEKRFVWSPTSWWAIVLEVMNASFSREVLRRSCQPVCENEEVGPIVLPSLGVTGQF